MTNRDAAVGIVKRLREHGHEALLAGGCVRDMLMGRDAKDYDVATSARPEEIVGLFRRTLEIGAKFGVVMVLEGGYQVEVATFRTEGGYTDGRHPGHVEYAGAKEDAVRRDFTVNGMFYDPLARRLIDYVGGREDLSRGVLRTIGDPNERFAEDYLRMLRAVRFSVQLDFEIEPATEAAVAAHAEWIMHISGERIAAELEGILTHPRRAEGAMLLNWMGLSEAIFPGHTGQRAAVSERILAELPEQAGFALALAGFFGGCGTDHALGRLELLRPSNALARRVAFLLQNRRSLRPEMELADLKMLMADEAFADLLALEEAIRRVEGRPAEPLREVRRRAETVAVEDVRPAPLLNGHELMALGVPAGPMVGRAMDAMYRAQLNGLLDTPPEAGDFVRRWLRERQG